MEKSAFSTLEKIFLIIVSFIPFLNGMTFVYMGSKESNKNWIIEGLVYELPWFLQFLFAFNEGISTTIASFGILFMFICLLRTLYVSFTYKKEMGSSTEMRKRSSSFWMVFSLIMFLNGIGLIIVGYKRNVQRWVIEGALFEFLWVLYLISYAIANGIIDFFIAISVIGWILSIARTIMIYFEEKRMDNGAFTPSTKPTLSSPAPEVSPKPVESLAVSEIIPEFKSYKYEIDNLKQAFDKKEDNITGLINKRFESGELSHNRFMSVIDSCHKLFYHQSDSATSIIEMAPEYSERLDETVKDKISIMESINDEMNNLVEELIIHDSDNEKSEEDLQELFSNMDNLINSVKDYK